LPAPQRRNDFAAAVLDNTTLSVHEARRKFAARWGVVAFTEAGRFADSSTGLADSCTMSASTTAPST